MSHDDAFAAFVAEKRALEARESEGRITWRRIDRHRDDGRGWSGIDGIGRLYFAAPCPGPDREVYEYGTVAQGGERLGYGVVRGPDQAKDACRHINYPPPALEEDPE